MLACAEFGGCCVTWDEWLVWFGLANFLLVVFVSVYVWWWLGRQEDNHND